MTTYEWEPVRENAIVGFGGQYPPGQLEAQIVEAFERDPIALNRAITLTTERYKDGKVRSPWHYLAAQAAQILQPAPTVSASDTGSRDRLVKCAEAWVRNAGRQFDRAEEVEAELFMGGGLLRDFADDVPLRGRMLNLWRELQPKVEAA